MRIVGRLLVGPEFDVTRLRRDREDAFVAAVCNRVVLRLHDDAVSRILFFPVRLARNASWSALPDCASSTLRMKEPDFHGVRSSSFLVESPTSIDLTSPNACGRSAADQPKNSDAT